MQAEHRSSTDSSGESLIRPMAESLAGRQWQGTPLPGQSAAGAAAREGAL